jgi:hypothetical protein
MAKKKAARVSDGATRKKRHRRSPEEIIDDLQDEIKRLRNKAAARALKESPAIKATMAAVRTLDKGLDEAARENNGHLRHALADARRSIAGYLDKQGVKLPKARLPKGPRPKEE